MNREKGLKSSKKPWKKHSIDKHIINKMVIEAMDSLDDLSDYEVLSLMTIDILCHGTRSVVNKNMELLMKRLIKVNPVSARLNT